jgi:glycosyltransferase involved in cell wall biosynthesis
MRATIEPFLREIYDRLPSRAKLLFPQRLKNFVRAGGSLWPLTQLADDRLWSGFSRSALADLGRIKRDPELPLRERAAACISLARWHGAQGDDAAALRELDDRRALGPRYAAERTQYMLETFFLCRLGRVAEATALLDRYEAGRGYNTSVQLMRANTVNPEVTGVRTEEAEQSVLACVNTVFAHYKVPGIEKIDPSAPLSIDNIRGKGVRPVHDTDNRVTVIVPAYNAAETIRTALRSLAEQSWQNIEVIVVDDCSTDTTAAVVEQFCANDPRFRLIRRTVNGGSYAARNLALREASGKYVTIHDADDWAHPSRIESQVSVAAQRGQPFNASQWARTSSGLAFWGNWQPSHKLTNVNMGSFMFLRSLTETAGVWDEVRVSSDYEFTKRLEVITGGIRRPSALGDCPLVFGRLAPESLTQTKATHLSTIFHGVRREYKESALLWHRALARTRNAIATDGRYFPSPPSLHRGGSEARHDLIVISDWNMVVGGAFHSAMNMLGAAQRDGLSCAVLHYPRYERSGLDPLRSDVRTRFNEKGIRILAPGETVAAATTVIAYPPILQHYMDRFPTIEGTCVVVVVNQLAERNTTATDIAYDPATARAHLVEYFGIEGDWAPISGTVRRIMEADPRYPRPHEITWTPMVDVSDWFERGPSWRGRDRSKPVIGRHGRDHWLKWPGDKSDLEAAYCAYRPCEMRFLGGALMAEAVIGRHPANWHSQEFGAQDVKAFLGDLDFFIHYPHEDYIEEFGRAPMEAMAIGVPVILPPVFRDTFGDAALYASADQVWATIETLWRDEAAWNGRVAAGQEFVARNCSYDTFAARLRPNPSH